MRFLLLPALLLLAACSGEDFSVDVDLPAEEVAAALAGLDADSGSDIALYKTQIFKVRDEGQVTFRFVAPKGNEHDFQAAEANLTFRLEALEPGRTRIAVDVDVPEIETYSTGPDKWLSEQKVIDRLQSALATYAAAANAGDNGDRALAQVDDLLTALALVMDKKSLQNLTESQWGAADFRDLVPAETDAEPAFGEPMDTPARFDRRDSADSEPSFGAPMDDPSRSDDDE